MKVVGDDRPANVTVRHHFFQPSPFPNFFGANYNKLMPNGENV